MKRNVRFSVISAILLSMSLLIGCAPQNVRGAKNVQPSQKTVSVPFQVLIKDADMTSWMPYKALKQEQYFPFGSEQQLVSELHVNSLDSSQPFPPAELQQIDFQKEIGFYLTRGLKGRGGYTLQVVKIEQLGTNLYVDVNTQDPKGMADSAMHYRVTLLKIPRDHLPHGFVNFVVRDQQGAPLSQRRVEN